MPVFRAATSDSTTPHSSSGPPHAANPAPRQRHAVPSGGWVPPRAPRPAYPEGPTEPLNATGENTARETAIREAARREAAMQEAAVREAAVREAAVREAAMREAAMQEAAMREAAMRESTSREAAAEERKPAESAPADTATRQAAVPVAAAGPSSGAKAGPRRAAVILALVFSLLALAASTVAGLFSWRTFETVKEALQPPQPAPVAASTRSAAPPRPERYRVAYAKEPLRLQLGCSASVHLDLDEPRADVAEAVADLRFESGCGSKPPQLSLGAGAAAGSSQASGDTDADGCDRAVRTSPLSRGLPVEARKGTAMCVLTAAVPAELVLVEIIDVGGSGTAGLRATSWQVP